jgi:hypothetical protein
MQKMLKTKLGQMHSERAVGDFFFARVSLFWIVTRVCGGFNRARWQQVVIVVVVVVIAADRSDGVLEKCCAARDSIWVLIYAMN